MKFSFFGHENIRAVHRNTIEFTKDAELTEKGDCILGVRADFDKDKLKKFSGRVVMHIRVKENSEKVRGIVNPDFSDDKELVIRRSDFNSARTYLIMADMACMDIDRDMVKMLKDPGVRGEVELEKDAQEE